MDETPNLKLPFILAAQSQKHVTHNEALRVLDAIVQLSVADKDLDAPPGSPAEGERYIVGSSPSGAWAGRASDIAAYQDGAWAFYAPADGWLAWVADEDALHVFNGAGWIAAPGGGGGGGGGSVNPVSLVGVNATANTTNRLSVSSPASLFNHEGAGHQLKINKDAAADTASVLFQTSFSGRAEFGLAGDDDFHVKVSANGSAWHEALVIDRATGKVRFPNTNGREVLAASRTYYVRTDGSDSNTGLANTSGGAFLTLQKAVDTAATLDLSIYDVTIQLGAGTYSTSTGVTCKQCIGAGSVIIVGDETTPSNVVLTTSGAMAASNGVVVSTAISTQYHVRGVRFTSTATGLRIGLGAGAGAFLSFQNCEFGSGLTYQIFAGDGGIVNATGHWAIVAGATYHIVTARAGSFVGSNGSFTVTLTGTPAFTAFMLVTLLGIANMFGLTFSGSATGSRYSVQLNGGLSTGGGANFLPGNSAGTTATGGQYA